MLPENHGPNGRRISPRHFAILSDDALECMSLFLRASEVLGVMPKQVRYTAIVLLPKPHGGFRPIGIFPALYRMYGQLRRSYCEAWETANSRNYFAASSGRSAPDVVWRQAVDAEFATHDTGAAASVLWDVTKFYESFDHRKLRGRARATGFPGPLMNVALNAYRAARFMTSGGMVAAALYAEHGVTAGCHFATTFVKVYTLPAFDRVAEINPLVRFDDYIDDFTISATGANEDEVVSKLRPAIVDLRLAVESDLSGQLSEEKAQVAASSDALAKRIRKS